MSVRRTLFLSFALCFAPTLAPAQSPHQPIVDVVHIDFMPGHDDAVPALTAYVAHASHDPNILHIELYQQISATNHYTLVETFRSLAAYNALISEPYTRSFRNVISPALGSPFDERLHTQVAIH
jgi:quinol monooxygenase YgiN